MNVQKAIRERGRTGREERIRIAARCEKKIPIVKYKSPKAHERPSDNIRKRAPARIAGVRRGSETKQHQPRNERRASVFHLAEKGRVVILAFHSLSFIPGSY